MRKNINKYLMLLVAFVGMIPALAFAASPGIPNQFYGTVNFTNGPAPDGLLVEAKVNGVTVGSATTAGGKYGYMPSLFFAEKEDGEWSGEPAEFYIGGTKATTATAITLLKGGYTNLNLTIPSNTVTSNGANVSLSSANAGEADMPAGATNVALTNTTVLNLFSGLVGREVTLRSGVNGSPIVLTNSNLSNISASIPDGTKIQGPAGWDGKITPPISGTPSGGTAPAGFSVGSAVISIGSPDGTLVFDKPVTILLAGVTGTVGYRPSGSNTWVQITNTCASPYATPGNPPANGECYISNGTDTKIVTYHFTSFGSLVVYVAPVAPAVVSSGGGGGGGYTPTPTPKIGDINGDSKVDKYDFSLMMSNWGKTGSNNSDLNNDNKVDKYDFALLMSKWGL